MTNDQTEGTALLRTFYACFAKGDYRGMAACYHPSIAFQDPVFNLKGKQVAAMWHMLLEGGKEMRVEATGVSAEGDRGQARWEAHYTFSATGRKVRNAVRSEFRFQDGKILVERDAFGFWRWAAQALGPVGIFLGWMPRLQQDLQRKAKGNLAKFIKAHPEYAD